MKKRKFSSRPQDWRKNILITVILLGMLIPILFLLHRYAFLRNASSSDAIYSNIRIHGVDVGSLSKTEAERLLMSHFQPSLDKKIIRLMSVGKEIAAYTFKDFEMRYDFSKLVETAWLYGRTGTAAERYRQINGLSRSGLEINQLPGIGYNEALIEACLQKTAGKILIEPVNASLQYTGSGFSVVPGQEGRVLDVVAAAASIRSLLAEREAGEVEAMFKGIPPRYKETDFDYPMTYIGVFSTPLGGGRQEPRTINVHNAAEHIHNKTIYPGEVFSVSAALGAITPENGYARATVIVAGQPADDYGGGVCQVVTTLYNAVLFAELPVVERFNHSVKVSYTDYGFDATVAGDYFDLKFKNDTTHPLVMVCDTGGGRLTVGLYGFEVHSAGRKLAFANELIETLPPEPDKVLTDASLALGQTMVVTEAKNGYRYEVYKYIYENDVLCGKEKVNTSVYKPVRGVIAVNG